MSTSLDVLKLALYCVVLEISWLLEVARNFFWRVYKSLYYIHILLNTYRFQKPQCHTVMGFKLFVSVHLLQTKTKNSDVSMTDNQIWPSLSWSWIFATKHNYNLFVAMHAKFVVIAKRYIGTNLLVRVKLHLHGTLVILFFEDVLSHAAYISWFLWKYQMWIGWCAHRVNVCLYKLNGWSSD